MLSRVKEFHGPNRGVVARFSCNSHLDGSIDYFRGRQLGTVGVILIVYNSPSS